MCSVSPKMTQAGCQLDFFLSLMNVLLQTWVSEEKSGEASGRLYMQSEEHSFTLYLADQCNVLSMVWGSGVPHSESPSSQWSLGSVAFGLLLLLGKYLISHVAESLPLAWPPPCHSLWNIT